MTATTDLCDANEPKLADGTLRVLAANFHHYGKHLAFSGPVKTLKVFEDNSLVRTAVESAGAGAYLLSTAAVHCAAHCSAEIWVNWLRKMAGQA